MSTKISPIFTLLQNEAALMEGCLSIGLTALRSATVEDKSKYYSGFFNTSIAFERLMKLIVVVDHMLSHDFIPPTKKELTKHGHDLNDLYQLSVEIANRADITMPPQDSLYQLSVEIANRTDITMLPRDSIEGKILNFLSKFAKFSRYYNLDSLNSRPSKDVDPLTGWEDIINQIIEEDVPNKKLKAKMDIAESISNRIEDITFIMLHGMSGELLTCHEFLSLTEKQLLASPYLMVRVFKILKPLIEIISALGDTGFYKRPPHIPHMLYIPIFGETLIAHFMADDATIKRKKRWP